MRKTICILIAALALQSCLNLKTADPYSESLNRLTVVPLYPSSFPADGKDKVSVSVTERNRGYGYSAAAARDGSASIELPDGSYRVSLNYNENGVAFNGTVDKVILSGEDRTINIQVSDSRAGRIVFKEIYCGGCTKYPEQGNYAFDSYVILHNNTSETQYLDSLCLGTLDPYRSGATNVWVSTDPETGETVFPEFLPIVQAIWQIGGDGKTFPLEPGGDAVIVIYGAIDHASRYPQSVNLNQPDYFVCYNTTYFPNTSYHPAPGNRIRQDHILNVVIKTGVANAYVFAQQSPAAVIFKAPAGTDIHAFVSDPSNIVQKPGSGNDRIVKLPPEWVIDGVEVFEKGAANKKRLVPAIDAGAVEFSGPYNGHTLFRNADEELSRSAGYEILVDTNNSTNDFYEREKQSLHE